jgi:TolB-like protein/Flp pilus assembly protein TadD
MGARAWRSLAPSGGEGMSVLAELKRRRVFRAMVGYGIVAFALLQVAEPVMHGAHLPDVTLGFMVVALGLGFPIVVVLAWAFDVSSSGIERHAPAGSDAHSLRGMRVALLLTGIGLFAAAPGLTWYFLRGTTKVGGVAATSVVPVGATASSIPSVAVLPFTNMSADKEQEYFSDGLAEEILNALAQVEGLHVCGRTSSFSFKGKSEDLRTIGEKLGVAHVLEGSVRKEGHRIRITAQLVAASNGYHVWSKTFEREMGSIFAVQDEIARSVVDALKVKLLARQGKEHRTDNSEAYTQYLLGRQFSRSFSEVSNSRAIDAYEKAIGLEPAYAPAWASLAMALSWKDTESLRQYLEDKDRALAAADKAITLDPDLADGYVSRGWIRTYFKWDWGGAESDFKRALALNPGDADIVLYYAHLHAALGRLHEAVAAKRRATELDPVNPTNWFGLSYMYRSTSQFELARGATRRIMELAPEWNGAACLLGRTSLLEGEPAAALSAYERCPDPGDRLWAAAVAQHQLGHQKESEAALEAYVAKFTEVAAYSIAQIHATRGDRDQAFDWLDRAVAQHDSELQHLKYDLMLRKLRDDARYAPLLEKMNLPLD